MAKRTIYGNVVAVRNTITSGLDHFIDRDVMKLKNLFMKQYENEYLMNVPSSDDWCGKVTDITFMINEFSYWKDKIQYENQRCPIMKTSVDDVVEGMVKVFTDKTTNALVMYVTVAEDTVGDITQMVRFFPNLKTCKTIMDITCLDYVIDVFNSLVPFNQIIVKTKSVKELASVENKINRSGFVQYGYEKFMKSIEAMESRMEFIHNIEVVDTFIESFCFVIDDFCFNKSLLNPDHLLLISGFIKSLTFSVEKISSKLYPELSYQRSDPGACVWKQHKIPYLVRSTRDLPKTESTIFEILLSYSIYMIENTFGLTFNREICDFFPTEHQNLVDKDVKKFVLYTSLHLLVSALLHVSNKMFTKAMTFRGKHVQVFSTDDIWKMS